MSKMRLLKATLLSMALSVSSCEYNVENVDLQVDDSCETVVSYSNIIRPLIDTNCMPCHNGDGTEPDAPDLTTYASVESVSSLIRQVTQSGRMPKEGSLTNAEIAAIKCWVDNDALDN